MELVKSLSSIEAVVNGGKSVISADNSIIVAMMQEALRSGRSATFYVSPAQAQAVMRWYWTPGRIKEIGYEPVSDEERAKIESELGIKCVGTWFSNRIQCQTCGVVYGMFEFMQQGLREHDRDWIKAVLELKDTSVLRVNPALDAICANCNRFLIMGHWYGMHFDNGTLIYGCCSGGDVGPILT
jgi:RNase P subunit RPR2